MTGANSDKPDSGAAKGGGKSFEVPAATEEALIGQVIGGRYEVGSLLGRGGFGSVFNATHTTTGQRMVVKVLRAEMAADPTQVKRFFNEAKTTCQLTHPHTVRVFDFGRVDSGQLYMAMELLDGNEFAVVLRKEAPLDPLRVTRITCAILKSLAEAHEAGLVHRDLKPGNVFLCDVHGNRDFVKLIDFGIAKSFDGEGEDDLTKTGFAVGTPKYMSPEQCRAEPLDGRSDLYSLGVMMYQALTGVLPFKASSAMELIIKHMQEPAPPIDERVAEPLPAGLGEVVMKALEKSPWDRFADADDMRASLEEVLADAGQPVPPESRAVSVRLRALDPDDVAAGQAGHETAVAAVAGAAVVAKAESAAPATLALDTGEAMSAVADAAEGTEDAAANGMHVDETIVGAAGDEAALSEDELAAMSRPTGVRTKIQRGVDQSSIVPSTPSRPGRNKSKYGDKARRQRGSGWMLPVIALLVAAGAGWLIWNVVKGRDVSTDLARRQAAAVLGAVEDKLLQPNVAPQGQREVEMPRLKKGSVKKRREYKDKVAARNEGVGKKGEPLSDKELQKTAHRARKSVLTCLRRRGERNRAYPRVPVSVIIRADGKVSEAVLDKDIGKGKLAACVEKAVRRLKFRGGRPGLETRMIYFGYGAIRKPRRRSAKGRTLPPTKYNGDKAL